MFSKSIQPSKFFLLTLLVGSLFMDPHLKGENANEPFDYHTEIGKLKEFQFADLDVTSLQVEIENRLTKEPNNPEFLEIKSLILFAQKNYTESAQLMLGVKTPSYSGNKLLALSHYYLKDYQKAEAYFEKVPKITISEDNWLRYGETLIHNNNKVQAAQEYELLLLKYTHSQKALDYLIHYYEKPLQKQKLISKLKVATQLQPNNPVYYKKLSMHYNNTHSEAISVRQTYLKLAPEDMDVKKELAELYISHKQGSKAIPLLKQVIKKDSKDKQSLSHLYQAYTQAKDEKNAHKVLKLCVNIDPQYNNYQKVLAHQYLKMGKTKLAVPHFEQWVSKNPGDINSLQELHSLFTNNKDTLKLIFTLEMLIEASPHNKTYAQQLAEVKYQKYQDVSGLEKLVDKKNAHDKAKRLLIDHYIAGGETPKLKGFTNTLKQLAKSNSDYLKPLAEYYLYAGNFQRANQHLLEWLKKEKANWSGYLYVYEKAVETKSRAIVDVLEEGAKQFPKNIEIKVELAQKTPSNTKKLELYRAILKLDPYNIKATQSGISLARSTKNHKDIEFFLNQWVKIEPGNEVPLNELKAYFKVSKNYTALAKVLNKLVELSPDPKTLYLELAQAHLNQNEKGAALKAYDQILKLDPTNKKVQKASVSVLKSMKKGTLKAGYIKLQQYDPGAHELQYEIARIYLTEKSPEKAYGYLDLALNTNPDNNTYQKLLPKVITKPEQAQKHIEILKKLAKSSTATAETKYHTATGYFLLGDYKKAGGYYRDVYLTDKILLKNNYNAILALFHTKDYAITYELSQNYLKNNPANKRDITEIAVKSLFKTKPKSAEFYALLQNFIIMEPVSEEWWFELAKLDLEHGKKAAAIKNAKKWVQNNENDIHAYQFLLPLVRKNSAEKKTLTLVLTHLIKNDTKAKYQYAYELGMHRYHEKDYFSAQENLTLASKSITKDAKLWNTLGVLEKKSYLDKQAEQHLKKATLLEPDNVAYAKDYVHYINTSPKIKSHLKFLKFLAEQDKNISVKKKLAQAYALNEKFSAAANTWLEIEKQEPTQLKKDISTAALFEKSGDFEKSHELYSHWHKKEPYSIPTLEALLRISNQLNLPKKNAIYLEKLVRVDPTYKDYQLKLANLAAQNGQHKKASENYQGYAEQHPKNIDALKGWLNSAKINKDTLSMSLALEGLTKIEGIKLIYHRQLALIRYLQHGEIEGLVKLTANKASFPEGKYYLAREYYQRGEFQNLVPFGSYLKRNYQKQPELAVVMAEWHVLHNNKFAAGKAYGVAVKRDPQNRDLFERALTYLKDTRGTQLKEMLAHGNKAYPKDLNLKMEYAAMLTDPEEALTTYQEALKINPDNPIALKGAARNSYKLKKFKSAEKYLIKWSKLEPSIEAWSLLSQVYQYEKAKEKQINAQCQMAKLTPEDYTNSFNAGKGLVELNKHREALDFLRNAASLKPMDHKTNKMLGLTLVKLNKYREAGEYLTPIVKNRKKEFDENVSAAIMEVYNKTNRQEEAFKQLQILNEKTRGKTQYALPLALTYSNTDKHQSVIKVVKNSASHHKANFELSELLLNSYLILNQKKDANRVATKMEAEFPKQAGSSVIMAKYFISDKKFPEAETVLSKVSPQKASPEINFLKGKVAYHRNKWDQCIEQLSKYKGPDKASNYYLGSCYQNSGKITLAIVSFELYYTAKNKFSTLETLFPLYQKQKQQEGQIKTLNRILKAKPDNEEYRIELANLYLKNKDKQKTEAEFRQVLKRNPYQPKANLILGKSLAASGDYEHAGKMLKIALVKYPKDWQAQLHMGNYYFKHKKDHRLALQHFRKSFRLNSKSEEAALAKLKAIQKLDLESALPEAYEDVLKIDPNNNQVAAELGNVRFEQKKYQEAASLYQTALKKLINDSKIWVRYAYSLSKLGDKPAALKAYQTAYKKGARSTKVKVNLARLLIENETFTKAESLLKEVLQKEPNHSTAMYNMALIARSSNQLPIAENYLQSALKINPTYSKFREELGRVHYLDKKYTKAVSVLSQISESHLSFDGKKILADAYYITGRSNDALDVYVNLYQKNPSEELLKKTTTIYIETRMHHKAVALIQKSSFQEQPEIKHNLAKAYTSGGEFEKAQNILEELRDKDKENPEYLTSAGENYYLEAHYKKSIKMFKKALKYESHSTQPLYKMGLAWNMLGEYEKAGETFQQLISSSEPEQIALGYYGLAQTQEKQKQYSKMVASLKKSLKENFSWEPMYLLTQGLLYTKDVPAAEELIRKAHNRNSEHPLTISAKAEILLFKNQKADAYRLLKRNLAKHPRSCDIVLQMAKVNWRMGNINNVTSNSRFALSVCPEKPEPYLLLGYVANKNYNKKEARKQFKTYVKRGGNEMLLPKGY